MVATWSMLTPRRRCEPAGTAVSYDCFRSIKPLSGDPVSRRHHLLGAQLRDDGVEMLEVIDLEIDDAFGEIRRAPLHADIVDVAVVLGDHGGDLGERAR